MEAAADARTFGIEHRDSSSTEEMFA